LISQFLQAGLFLNTINSKKAALKATVMCINIHTNKKQKNAATTDQDGKTKTVKLLLLLTDQGI